MKRAATALAIAMSLALGTQAAVAQTLKTVKDRGELVCGANGTLAGFGRPDPQGNWVGFDVDSAAPSRQRFSTIRPRSNSCR